MLRTVLVSLLALAACKDDGAKASDPPAQGMTAGKVVEASGTVSATRDGKSRALAAGAEVAGDDTVETGADGHVVIHLAHNNATWDLGANKKQRVDASMAWTLAKQDGSAATVDQATSAAGRHAERSAADTVATAEPQAQSAAPPAASAAPAAPPKPEPMERGDKGAAPPPPPPPADSEGGKRAPAPGAGGGLKQESAKDLGAAQGDTAGAPNQQDALQHAINNARADLLACLPDKKTHVKATLNVLLGSVTFKFAGKAPSETVKACLDKRIKALGVDGDAKLSL